MSEQAALIIQVPRGAAVDHYLRGMPPAAASTGQVIVEHLAPDASGRLGPPAAGEVVLSVPSPEALTREAVQVRQVVSRAKISGEPLVILVQVADELREDEIAVVLSAAAHTRRPVLLRVLGGA